jgi:hypothetical protein
MQQNVKQGFGFVMDSLNPLSSVGSSEYSNEYSVSIKGG